MLSIEQDLGKVILRPLSGWIMSVVQDPRVLLTSALSRDGQCTTVITLKMLEWSVKMVNLKYKLKNGQKSLSYPHS